MRNKERKEMKETTKKVMKGIKIILFITMLVLIYIASPRVTQLIQEEAKALYEMDSNLITRVVELFLAVVLISILTFFRNKKGE